LQTTDNKTALLLLRVLIQLIQRFPTTPSPLPSRFRSRPGNERVQPFRVWYAN